MRIEKLASRIAAAPRSVVIALVALTAVTSPGFIRATPEGGTPPIARDVRGGLASRPIAIFALGCADGVYTAACLRFVARVTDALEADAGVTGPVRSLTRARVVTHAGGDLALEPLVPRIPTTDTALRALRARLGGDAAQARYYVAAGDRETRVYADLDPQLSAERARALAESLRQRFERAPGLMLSARSLGERASPGLESISLALVAALALLALVLAPGSWRTSALAAAGALAFALFAHGLLRLLGEPSRLLGGLLPALLGASALAASFALMQRVRSSPTPEGDAEAAIAETLAELGPALAIAGALTASGVALCLALSTDVSLARALAAGAGLALGLVVYPLGVTIAGLRAWPARIAAPAGELRASLRSRVERGLTRPRLIASSAAVVAALGAWGAAAIAPAPEALRLRTVVLDSGTRSGALDPAFLERVQAFQRQAEREPGVLASRSLVDTIVAPAYRALHDGDPAFATVPPTREDVERALRPWLRDARRELSGQVDAERRRVAVSVLEAPGEIASVVLPTRPVRAAILSLLGVAALGALALGSLRGGVLCATPGAIAAPALLLLAQIVAPGGSAAVLAPLGIGLTAAFVLPIAVRVRALLNARAELEVAVALSLRESGSATASAALAGAAMVAAIGIATGSPAHVVVLACLTAPLGAAAALSTLPPLFRWDEGRAFARDRIARDALSDARR